MAMRWGKLYKGTPAELAIEPAVARLGLVYRTQFPGYMYGFRAFPDFFLPQLGLVIEVDDPSHSRADKILEDQERTELLESFGWRVVRTTNEKALSDPDGAVRAALADAGITRLDIEEASRRPVSLPARKSAPQAGRRSAQRAKLKASRARRASRGKSPRSTRRTSRPAAAEAPPPTEVP
jgi:hypothetical protein